MVFPVVCFGWVVLIGIPVRSDALEDSRQIFETLISSAETPPVELILCVTL